MYEGCLRDWSEPVVIKFVYSKGRPSHRRLRVCMVILCGL